MKRPRDGQFAQRFPAGLLFTSQSRVPATCAVLYLPVHKTGSAIRCLLLHGSFTAAQEHLTLMANEAHGVTDAEIGLSYLAGVLVLSMLTGDAWGEI